VTILNNAADTILRMSPIYVANNTDKVNSFRSEICMNNCSGNGICAETGVLIFLIDLMFVLVKKKKVVCKRSTMYIIF
jgi:hypothetical protein